MSALLWGFVPRGLRGRSLCGAAALAVFAAAAVRAQDTSPNIVATLSGDAAAITIAVSSPAPAEGLRLTVGLSCDAASGVSVDGATSTEVSDLTVAGGGAPDIRACARVWEVAIDADASKAVFAPQIAASAAGRLIEFFLADPPAAASDAVFSIDDSARYVAVVRGLSASFAAENPRVVVEGQNAALTITLSGAVDFPGAAVSVVVSGDADDPADYTLDGLSGGGVAVADDASAAAFTVNTATDSTSEGAGDAKVVPHEAAIFEITDSRGSGFAIGDSAAMTLLIADGGDHSPIVFDTAETAAVEGESVIASLSFKTLPTAFSITLTGAKLGQNGDWVFPDPDSGCAELNNNNNNRRCVILIAAHAAAEEVVIRIKDDNTAELAEEIAITLTGDAPPGYAWDGVNFIITVAASDVNAKPSTGTNRNTRLIALAFSPEDNGAAMRQWIDAGADVNIRNRQGDTALHFSTFWKSEGELDVLIGPPGQPSLGVSGIMLNVVNNDTQRQTPLDRAHAGSGRSDANYIARLRAAGLRCNSNCKRGDTRLDGTVKP